MTKYAPLESHLRDSGRAHLPMSAFRHRALWSNNPGNWVMTKAWLAAGYETERVDMTNGRLVFRRAVPPPDTGGGPPAPRDGEPPAPGGGSFARVFGALKGTVTIMPGTDLTDSVGEDWDATR